MNILSINDCDIANGPGVRISLWVAGCGIHCPGCHNKKYWDPNSGRTFLESDKESILNELKNTYIKGLSILGGDPLYFTNIKDVEILLKEVKTKFPDKEIWLWTGYLWEDVKNLSIMNYIDVLIDGPFILKDRNITLKYKGSPNQRVIDVKESLAKNSIILRDD